MLTVAQVEFIKHLRQVEGKTIAEIARILGIDWRTAKKYADNEPQPVWGGPRRRRSRPVIGGFDEVIDVWLTEDLRMPAKQRRTARAIFCQLQSLGYEGSERTVRRRVRESRQKLHGDQQERYARLEHPPGSAQVDFGRFRMIGIDGVKREYALLVMSFPHSNAALVRVVPAENAECLLEGLKSMFEQAGGAPPVIWFDNLAPAVKKILEYGERELSEMFARFRWHYRFRATFCNPARGHEKGSVENKLGYVRRNYLTPPPVSDDLEIVNLRLRKSLDGDMDREHYEKKLPIRQLWAEDKNALLVLPAFEFEVARPVTARVNRMNEIRLDGEVYHVPRATPDQQVFLKVLWDRIEIYDAHGTEGLGQVPRKYAFKAEKVDWAAELALFVSKPRAVEHATYVKALPQNLRDFMLNVPVRKRSGRIRTLVKLFQTGFSLKAVQDAVRTGQRYAEVDTSSLMAIAASQAVSEGHQALAEPHTPDEVRNWRPDLARYDLLTREVAGNG